MIKKIIFKKKELHFHKPFRISYEEAEKTEVIFIKIIDDKNNVGIGSVSSYEEVTAEDPAKVLKILKNKLTKDFFNLPFQQWYAYHEKIQQEFFGFPSVQAGIEEAFLNLWSQNQQIPLSNLFGGFRKKCPIMITIGIKDKKATIIDIKQRLKEGFKVIKLKCGINLKDDLARIKLARKIMPKNCQLILDANQGYSFLEAKKLLLSLKNSNIALMEQPINAKDINGLKKLHLLSSIPVIADEAVVTVDDAINLLTNNYVAGVNIKLTKCGGPINFIKIFNLAKSLKKIIMLGCVYESNVSITTGAHLALALPIDYVDLDSGHLDFYDDPVKGGAIVEKGEITVNGYPILTD